MNGNDDRRSRRRALATSVAAHAVLLGIFPFLIARVGGRDAPEPVEIVFHDASAAPPPPVEPRPEPERRPEPKVEPPAEAPPEKPRPVPPKPRRQPRTIERRPEPEPVVAARPPQPEPPAPRTAPPEREVRTAGFGRAAAQAEPARPVERRTHTGSFGETVATAPARASTTHRAAPRTGSFAIAVAASDPEATPAARERVVAATGFGGAPAESPAPAAAPRRTTVESAGFDSSAAGPEAAPGNARPSAAISTGGFGDAEVTAMPPQKHARPETPPETPVQIMSKPSPAYTEEARALRVEGEVVLEVVFAATGEMRVVGVVEGLGHGLDESAIDAARKIEFKPAKRNGKPVDHAAVVRIVFQLA